MRAALMKRHNAHFEKLLPVIPALLAIPLTVSPAARGRKNIAEAKASVTEGQKLFKENCNLCHYPDKIEDKIGPGLKDLFKNKALPESHKPVTDANVREQIEKGSPDAKPMPMPAFAEKLKRGQIDSLMAYLKTL
jgi:mono/diheme cytochrome c family protein